MSLITKNYARLLFVFTIAVVAVGCFDSVRNSNTYYTTHGTGPDKCASVWLLERHHEPLATVQIVEKNKLEALSKDQVFDEPEGRFFRTGSSTTYTALADHFALSGALPITLGRIIQEIEIDAWNRDVSLESRIVEHGFRAMQLRYGRNVVVKACYLEFFDNVATYLNNGDLVDIRSPNDLIPEQSCLAERSGVAEADDNKVPTIPLDELLSLVSAGKKPVFVDTRETWEFEEGHIPGAINMKLREINSNSVSALKQQEWVIAYCVKDFRGYEAAYKLRSHGVNAAIMTPHGIRGWIEADLPISGERGVTEEDGIRQLLSAADLSKAAAIQ